MAWTNAEGASANRDGGSDPGAVAAAIRRDFQLLVDALERHMDLQGEAASEIRLPLEKARRAAERGVEISERLLKSIADRATE